MIEECRVRTPARRRGYANNAGIDPAAGGVQWDKSHNFIMVGGGPSAGVQVSGSVLKSDTKVLPVPVLKLLKFTLRNML